MRETESTKEVPILKVKIRPGVVVTQKTGVINNLRVWVWPGPSHPERASMVFDAVKVTPYHYRLTNDTFPDDEAIYVNFGGAGALIPVDIPASTEASE